MALLKPDSLTNLITAAQLRRLAGATWFDRGEAYFAEGQVRSIRCDGEMIAATVTGTRKYRVKLWQDGRELAHSCSCPLGDEGAFCKHCVAVGLAWLANCRDDGEEAATAPSSTATPDDIRSYLSGLATSDLVELIMAQARQDDSFHQRLLLHAAEAKQAGGQLNATVWRQAFDEAVESSGFVPYGEAGGYAGGIGEVVDSVEALLAKGHAEAVIGLSEYGLEAIEEALENVDDSNGEMGSLLDRLQELHLAACRQAAPDPEDLARRLFEWESTGEGYVFHGAAASYAEVLGERGLALYRRLAEAEWKKLPAVAPGNDDPDRYGKRHRITSIMEALAELSGDLEALVEIKSRDLSLPHGFLEIATLYKEAGQADRALDWAERGWRAFPGGTRPDERLREFLADAYHDRDRHDEAMALIWEAFVEYPDFQSYRNLHEHAKRSAAWPIWRDKALSHIRERISASIRKQTTKRQHFPPWTASWSDRSVLVETFCGSERDRGLARSK